MRYDAKLLSAKAAGDDAGACRIAQQAMDDLGPRELSVQPFYDLGLWGRSFRAIYNQHNAFPDVP